MKELYNLIFISLISVLGQKLSLSNENIIEELVRTIRKWMNALRYEERDVKKRTNYVWVNNILCSADVLVPRRISLMNHFSFSLIYFISSERTNEILHVYDERNILFAKWMILDAER